MRRFFSPLLLLAALFAFANEARALDVRQTRWGFDGKVAPDRFAILSVLVDNPGGAIFDGELALDEGSGIGGRTGAPYAIPLYLAPGQAKWVQFVPYLGAENRPWTLRWGRKTKENVEIAGPAFAPPARVLLLDATSPFASEQRLAGFAEDLFPTSVAATDGLGEAVLDHVPRWEPARREAFLDWVKRGGIVHLLAGGEGKRPEFSGELAVLNPPATALIKQPGFAPHRVGAGSVIAHAVPRGEAGEEYFKSCGFAAREFKQSQNTHIYDLDDTLLRRLAELTKPRIAWWLIYLLSAAYLFVVGPAHFIWGRKLDYRVAIGAFLGAVAVFGFLFAYFGRRGSGEKQSVQSIAIARSLGGGRYDVTQWLSAFATDGDIYDLTHPGAVNFYSCGPMQESVNGTIRPGKDGVFHIDIPLYSSRPFMHRAVLAGDDTSVVVEKWNVKSGQDFAFELRMAPTFTKRSQMIWAQVGDKVFEMQKNDGLLYAQEFRAKTKAEFFDAASLSQWSHQHHTPWSTDELAAKQDWRAAVGPALMARVAGNIEGLGQYIDAPALPADQARLFIVAPVPEGFRLKGKGFNHHSGLVLYVQDIFKP